MPIRKSELYSSLCSSCDGLRGGMDASEYKNYILVLLFIKYVSDKCAGQPYAPITIRKGASFKDMVALKGKPVIGDQINKKIVQPLMEDNKLSGAMIVDERCLGRTSQCRGKRPWPAATRSPSASTQMNRRPCQQRARRLDHLGDGR